MKVELKTLLVGEPGQQTDIAGSAVKQGINRTVTRRARNGFARQDMPIIVVAGGGKKQAKRFLPDRPILFSGPLPYQNQLFSIRSKPGIRSDGKIMPILEEF
jgi:hypothetical protein